MEKLKLLSLKVTLGERVNFIRQIITLARSRQSSYVCVANAHMIVEARRNKSFRKVLIGADIVTPDGMSLVNALRLLHGIKQERVAGPDLLVSLLKEAEVEGLSVFFYGGTPEMMAKTSAHLQQAYPGLTVAGSYAPPFRPLTDAESAEMINMISGCGAHIVFVVLGCPKQERWMSLMKGKIPAVMIGVGGAVPMLIGETKRAPLWVQNMSMEWAYRLKQEPRRLFKRYMVTNTAYMFLLLNEKIRLFTKTPVRMRKMLQAGRSMEMN